MMGSKKGVVAYRLKRVDVLPPPNTVMTSAPPAPARAQPVVARRPAPVAPASVAVPGGTIRSKSPLELPTLRYGAGLKPAAPDENVRLLQTRLGIAADGRFGAGTRTAVRAFQQRRGLSVDGIVGRKTWTALFTVSA
jgi:peptidoglycan hydrolase-like protein with peptidoglycan-binding domain